MTTQAARSADDLHFGAVAQTLLMAPPLETEMGFDVKRPRKRVAMFLRIVAAHAIRETVVVVTAFSEIRAGLRFAAEPRAAVRTNFPLFLR
jgi:hypothetical protein